MRTKIAIKNILLMTLLIGLLSACGTGRYAIKPANMYKGPDFQVLPQKVTVFFPILPMVNDVVSYDPKIIAWNVGIWDEKGKEEFCLALRLGLFDEQGRQYLVAVYPYPKTKLVGKRVAVLGHCGQYVYDLYGHERALERSWGQIDIDKYKNFLTPVKADSDEFVEMDTSSNDFQQLAQVYRAFWVAILNEEARKYGYKKMVSSLTEEEMKELAKHSPGVKSFLKWLGEDWKVIFSVPVLPPQEILANMVIAKIFTLPSLWAQEVDRMGCVDAHPTARQVVEMVDRYFRLYALPYLGQKQTERRRE